MSKLLIINSCGQCPHLGIKTVRQDCYGLDAVYKAPICREKFRALYDSTVLFDDADQAFQYGRETVPPDWCPLPDADSF